MATHWSFLPAATYGRCGTKGCPARAEGYLVIEFQDRRGRWKKQYVPRCRACYQKAAAKRSAKTRGQMMPFRIPRHYDIQTVSGADPVTAELELYREWLKSELEGVEQAIQSRCDRAYEREKAKAEPQPPQEK